MKVANPSRRTLRTARYSTFALLLPFFAQASAHADYSRHDKVPQLTATLRMDFGFDETDIAGVIAALRNAQRLPQLVEQEQKAPEKTETWTQYARRIDDSRVQNGIATVREYAGYFARAEAEFGVPPAVVAAVMGIETRYGRVSGKIRVLDSLTTQGFDHPTRSPFFLSELAEFFAFCRDFGFAPDAPQGSYAGAMGAAQFMPSNYRRLAIDYDADGRRDLWTLPDAIGSIANYLTSYRPRAAWRRGEPIAVRATLKSALPADAKLNGKLADYTVAEAKKLGLVPQTELPADTRVGLIRLTLDDGGHEYWLGLHNFYSLMSYNPRTFYAMSVTQLAGHIEQQLAVPAR